MFRRFFAAKPDAHTHIDLVHEGVSYTIQLKRAASARKFTLRIRSATRDVVMTVPSKSSLRAAKVFAERNVVWIESRLRQLPIPVRFLPGQTIPIRGVDHLIVHRPGVRKTVWIEPEHSNDQSHLCVSGEASHIERRIKDYLQREAKCDIVNAVKFHVGKIGKSVHRITLRDTTSRWGSCSSKGSLNFSWRLIFAPGYVLDYLAAHEVAHLVHMDHSSRFWSLTASLAPDYERAEAWLKKNGAALHRFSD